MGADALLCPFLFRLEPQATVIAGLPISSPSLEAPSQTNSETCFLGDLRSRQDGSHYEP